MIREAFNKNLDNNASLDFVIFIIVLLFSFLGALLGNKLGRRYERNSKIIGGIILIVIGIKILLEYILGW